LYEQVTDAKVFLLTRVFAFAAVRCALIRLRGTSAMGAAPYFSWETVSSSKGTCSLENANLSSLCLQRDTDAEALKSLYEVSFKPFRMKLIEIAFAKVFSCPQGLQICQSGPNEGTFDVPGIASRLSSVWR
jgi:hypothetical protein